MSETPNGSKISVVSIVGARPQFIKAFAVSRKLRTNHEEILVHTGQHYDEELSDVFFEELGIPEPDYNLGIGSDTHGQQTAAMIKEIESVIKLEDPDIILIYGDTNSTLAGAITASKIDSLVAHVEAGLRSYNREMPEEINRILTDHASDILFPPSESSANTLKEEGISENVHVVGDVMYDSILWARDISSEQSEILSRLNLEGKEYILSTIHRAANTDNPDRLNSIINALLDSPSTVVLPIHPRTENKLRSYDMWEKAKSGIEIIDPVGYLDFVRLIDESECVATDSGGVQKEAFYLDTPCITMRDETEWIETVESGWNVLVGADKERIQEELRTRHQPQEKPNPYGDGTAAIKIVDTLVSSINE